MNKDKVYLKGYVIGRAADTLGHEGLMVQLENLDVVEIDKNLVHRDINEPQKVTVPQFVGDFIAEQKKLGHMLSYSIDACMSDRVAEWYWDNSELFALAWINGYAVEKEKKYFVKLKGMLPGTEFLKHNINEDTWYMGLFQESGGSKVYHTKEELEAGDFGDVFNSPLFEVDKN
nr:MAG TPA: Protein of unknown function (DUF1642) [Caudoviricetes sp.]